MPGMGFLNTRRKALKSGDGSDSATYSPESSLTLVKLPFRCSSVSKIKVVGRNAYISSRFVNKGNEKIKPGIRTVGITREKRV